MKKMLWPLALIVVLLLCPKPLLANNDVVDSILESEAATRDVFIRYNQEWVEKGYWLLSDAHDPEIYVTGGVGGLPVPLGNPTIIIRIITVILNKIHQIASAGQYSIRSALLRVENAIISYFQDIVKNEIQGRIDSFGRFIKNVLPPLYQPRMITDFNVMGMNPLDIGRGLLHGILQIAWAVGLLLILLDLSQSLATEGGRSVITHLAMERLVIWFIGVVAGLHGYEILTAVYRMAGDVFVAVCQAGGAPCAIGEGLSYMFYGAGANATSFLVAAIVLIGGIIVFVAGVVFFLIRSLLSFILAFVAPLAIGVANIPPLQILSEIWIKMLGAFIGVNLLYALLGMTMTFADQMLLSSPGEATAIVRMLTAIAFGVISAAGMVFVLKKSFLFLKFVAKSEILRMQMRQMRLR